VPLLVLDSGLVAGERIEIPEAGANTILTVPCTPAELVAHVHTLGRIRAAAREFAASCVAARLPHARLEALTEREVDVLRLLASGQTDLEIGTALHVAARTARFHVGSILRKLLARNRAHAATFGALFELLQVEFAASAPLDG
jgi:DNA-binding NarL/FixJ family response regulator